MIRLALLRHGPTAWNAQKRLQGRTDIPLSPAAQARLATLAPPGWAAGWHWMASPLSRAVATARALGHGPETVPALIEMDWGDYEGETIQGLRARHGADFAAAEDRGLDFRPPGGESPADVQARLRPWLAAIGSGHRDIVAVTHKGVIRAALCLATGWDMMGRPPVKLDWQALHRFTVDETGRLTLDQANLALEPRP
jgi:probable phosphoglycerate mutase